MMTKLTVAMGALAWCLFAQTPFRPEIPKVWDDEVMRDVELPLAARIPVRHAPSEYYYQLPVRANLKTYPIYAPGREPKGYWEWLLEQEPQPAFDPAKLRTKEDWIKAGEAVFESPRNFAPINSPFTDVRNPKWYEHTQMKLAKDGVVPFFRYVVTKKGTVRVNFDSCAQCHTRVLDDGTIVKGAQGNVPFGRMWSYRLTVDPRANRKASAKGISRTFFGAPWIEPDPTAPLSEKTLGDFVDHAGTIPVGVNPRQGTSLMYPVQIPDLIGIQDRIYLDHTGLQHHRSVGDLMRYAAINNFIEELTDYNGFRPVARDGKLPSVPDLVKTFDGSRATDEELYALALFLYSLKPPPNPNRFDGKAAKGKKVFERAGCKGCHTAPLYTNNMLTPAPGFQVPAEDRSKFRIMDVSVGTDPFVATKTRRGTGYYKVPSLKGVWYRGPFEHNGSVATLEDWFDERRLRDDYVPTGYVGYEVKTRAVKGHEFGLRLNSEDKSALIAFLKTL